MDPKQAVDFIDRARWTIKGLCTNVVKTLGDYDIGAFHQALGQLKQVTAQYEDALQQIAPKAQPMQPVQKELDPEAEGSVTD